MKFEIRCAASTSLNSDLPSQTQPVIPQSVDSNTQKVANNGKKKFDDYGDDDFHCSFQDASASNTNFNLSSAFGNSLFRFRLEDRKILARQGDGEWFEVSYEKDGSINKLNADGFDFVWTNTGLMKVYKKSKGRRTIGPIKATSWGCDQERTDWFTGYLVASMSPPKTTYPTNNVQTESVKNNVANSQSTICKNLRMKALKHVEDEKYEKAAEVKNLMESFQCST